MMFFSTKRAAVNRDESLTYPTRPPGRCLSVPVLREAWVSRVLSDSRPLCCSRPSIVIVDRIQSIAKPHLRRKLDHALSRHGLGEHVTLVLVRVHLGKPQPLVRASVLQCQHPKSDVLHAPWSPLVDNVKRAAAVTVQHRDRRFTLLFKHRGEPQSLNCTRSQNVQLAFCRAQRHTGLTPRPMAHP